MPNCSELKNVVPQILTKHSVPGVCIALIEKGNIVLSEAYGLRNSVTGEALETDAVFEAASLTKPIAAYAALLLCDQGLLAIDKPLYLYIDKPYLENQPLYELITLRHVLSHTCGFPNFAKKGELKVLFKPGEKFSYSGEGFMYLQHVVEHITGQPFDQYVKERVFEPLNMMDSSLIWQERFEKEASYFHDKTGGSPQLRRSYKPRAKGSLLTTSNDYARFIVNLIKKHETGDSLIKMMFESQIALNEFISWSLGWGVAMSNPHKSYWHWGDNDEYKAFTSFDPVEESGIVVFTNAYKGLSVCKEVTYHIFGEHFAFSKLLDEWYKEDSL